MRRYGVLLLLAIVALIAALRSQPNPPALALAPQDSATPTETPTVGILLPLIQIPWHSFFPNVALQPTLTPTPTPTLTPSVTPTQFVCNGRFDGSISLIPKADGSTTYATYIEQVHILQWVHNNNGQTTCFGILGYNLIGPGGTGPYQFNSQWSASGSNVPNHLLTISANCWGPYGQPCAGSQSSGQQVDTSIGTHPKYIINQPGVYAVYYMVCYSDFNACQKAGSNWAQLGVIQFTAINWTPGAPSGTETAPTPESQTGPACYLITDDPAGIYLNCNTSHLKERQLFQH